MEGAKEVDEVRRVMVDSTGNESEEDEEKPAGDEDKGHESETRSYMLSAS